MEERREREQAEGQSLVLRLRQHQTRAEEASQSLALIQQAISEHDKAVEAMKQLKKMKAGDEMLVSIGASSLIYVTLSNPEKIIVNLGGGVSVEKTPDAAMEYLREKRGDLENSQQKIADVLQSMEMEAQKIQARLQEIAASHQT
jgi:prefoldin alpha subunit